MSQGCTPFASDDEVEVLQMASRAPVGIEYKKGASADLVDLITRLVQTAPEKRLDCGRAREHALFGAFDFARMARRELSAPYVPKVKNKTDTSHFDQSTAQRTTDEEEMLNGEFLMVRDSDPMIAAAFGLWGGDENV